MKIIHGDCLEEMKKMSDNSIDCIVTDPPYGLSFMGKKWDKKVPSVDYWKEMLRIAKPGSFLLAAGAPRSHHHLAMAIENAGWEITDCIMHLFGSGFPKGKSQLKPAYEPWILARKRADKVQHLNIDDCRIESNEITGWGGYPSNGYSGGLDSKQLKRPIQGRWPANLILGDEEVEAMLDEQNRFFYCAKASKSERNKGCEGIPDIICGGLSGRSDGGLGKQTIGKNNHPTVKPQKLMEYLIKLVMPKHESAVLLDPFMGSGSTLVACKTLGVSAIGIEMNEEYCEIANSRINQSKAA